MTVGTGIAIAGIAIGLALLAVRCITYRARRLRVGRAWWDGYQAAPSVTLTTSGSGSWPTVRMSGPREAAPRPRRDTTGRQQSRTGGRPVTPSRAGTIDEGPVAS